MLKVDAVASVKSVLQLFLDNGQDAEHPTAVLAEGQCDLWVAEVDDTLAGVLLGRCTTSDEEIYGGIDTLLVDEKYRRQGIGRRLMEEAESYYRSQMVDSLRLNVNVDNFLARSLYESLGYQIIREYVRPRGLLRRFTMEKRLNPTPN